MQAESQTILRARREFLTIGTLQQGAVAEPIERSWRRCLADGVDTSSPVDNVLTRHELARKRDMNHLLLSHAQPEMTTLGEQIAHTRSMVILTDDEGLILHSLGEPQFLDQSR